MNGLQWSPDLTNAGNNTAPNSKLLVGPVNMTHDKSSYQCVFSIIMEQSTTMISSSVGTITVVGKTTWYTYVNQTTVKPIMQFFLQ